MRKGWVVVVAIAALGSLAYLPTHLPLQSLPGVFRWLAIASLCWAPVAIVRALLDHHHDATDTDAIEEMQRELVALRSDIEARFADVTLAIDDLAPRTLTADHLDEDRG